MKRMIALLLCLLMLSAIAAGCANAPAPGNDTAGLRIVTTIFPEYDWVNTLIKDQAPDAKVTMLLDNGVDLHSFQPSADDIITISTCDLFLYVGGESDSWVEEVLQKAANKDMVVIKLMDVLGAAAKEEEVVEGMQADHAHDEAEDEDHAHDEAEEADHAHDEPAYDEHIWLSLRNASLLCTEIAQQLCAIDPAHREGYQANLNAYLAKLAALDAAYQAAVDNSDTKLVLFGDRFPFRYLADDYGLSYYAAFEGCSAETEASFETIAFLAGKIDELGLDSVLAIEGRAHGIPETIISSTRDKDQAVLTMDSMQSTTTQDAQNGVSYLSIMEHNLEVLKAALQ